MSEAAAVALQTDEMLTRQWLALALTPGLGANKSRRLVEFFGTIQAVFRATLTELEAAGLSAVSA
jgi:excinuclease UvrABC nuclease subunit